MADAAPAFSGGTAVVIWSLVSVSARPTPRPMITNVTATVTGVGTSPTSVSTPYPTAASRKLDPMSTPGRTYRTSRTASSPAVTDAASPGTSTRPASIGLSPAASCRNCDTMTSRPENPSTDSRFADTAPENTGLVNSRTSSIGDG